MTSRPELVDVWIFRIRAGSPEILMLRRSPTKVLPGLWQGVSGGIEEGETIAAAALREVVEETEIGPSRIDGFYTLDLVTSFYWEPWDRAMSSTYFALRVGPDTEPTLSHEHDASEWLAVDEALRRSVWPAYRDAITRINENLLDPEREPWFRIELPAEAGL